MRVKVGEVEEGEMDDEGWSDGGGYRGAEKVDTGCENHTLGRVYRSVTCLISLGT